MLRTRPRGLLRALLRLPVYLYRLGLGRLLGRRFLLLTHRGRRTGLLRQTVLEVIHYDRRTRESTVLAALGRRSDWLRNLEVHPPLQVETGHERYVPDYRVLTPEETASALERFEREHRLEAKIAPRLLGWRYDSTEAGRRRLAESLVFVTFRPLPRGR